MKTTRTLASLVVFAGAALAFASCSKATRAVSIDLRTDMSPGVEFKTIVSTSSGRSVTHEATEPSDAFVAGTRVADFADLADGNATFKVALLDEEGVEVVARVTNVTVSQDYALTVVITRSCAGVVCPVPEGDQSLSTCQAGQCVNPECTPDTPEKCPEAQCASGKDCLTPIECLDVTCTKGVCLFARDDGKCGTDEKCNPDKGCESTVEVECTKTSEKETNCTDDVDDDCDGRIDCLDEDCNGIPCDDGNACTTGETCGDSTCGGPSDLDCDDKNKCTSDSCDPKTGCTHENAEGSCDDGDACTTGDVCADGACKPGTTTSCDDENPCTDDACDASGGCTHTNNAASCDDGNACTTGDVCAEGKCMAGAADTCDDTNPCTDDSCDVKAGCSHANNAGACDDGVFCNGIDSCKEGKCNPGVSTPCATSACDETTRACVGCNIDADCGGTVTGEWDECGGFTDPLCGTDGTQSRTVTTVACVNKVCVPTPTTEAQACTRVTEGNSCGNVTKSGFGACDYSTTNVCDEAASRSQDVHTPTCHAGTCKDDVTKETEACTRNQDGKTGAGCKAADDVTYGACSYSTCATSGSKPRTTKSYACANGACKTTTKSDSVTTGCTRTVANGKSCGGSNFCCSGSCVANGNNHCGSCGAVCKTGSCGHPVGSQWGCTCNNSNQACINDGYGSLATCYNDGSREFCNCQCPGGAASCSGQCAGGGTCHDVSGQNYCTP